MDHDIPSSRTRFSVAAGVFVLAVGTILYPAYGPGGFVGQGLGTDTEVLVASAVSLVVAALVFGTRFVALPAWNLVVAILGLAGALGGAEWTGVPVVFGGAAAYFAVEARQRGESTRLRTAALIIGVLAVIATIAVVVLEPLTD